MVAQIEIEKEKNKNPIFDSETILNLAVKKAFDSMLKENEINYLLTILKKSVENMEEGSQLKI